MSTLSIIHCYLSLLQLLSSEKITYKNSYWDNASIKLTNDLGDNNSLFSQSNTQELYKINIKNNK